MTPNIPAGTVTFLFTDIEGSTQLWEEYPEKMKAALAQHDALLSNACETHNGYVFKTVGDAFCAAFTTALDALNTALDTQRQLQAPLADLAIKVRMALHTGAAEERNGDYFGPPLNRVARLLSAGHGGQTLLSLASQELVRDQLPAGVTLRDLGERRLKDLVRPEHVFQVIAPDLPADFPPLKTLDTLHNNLPVQLTSFVGREKEMAEVKNALAHHRLVTLTGPGGTGKTRLSLQVAADVLDSFPRGVWLVELAPLADPTLVPQTVATALGLREQQDRPAQDTLTDYLREKSALLILDNCEHLVEACAALADLLLRACPSLKILTSSREALGVAGEVSFQVPSLSNPDHRQMTPLEALTQYEAVRLFIERATTVLPSFTVTNQNAPALAQVCHRLDGIPLAIELAAARVKVLRVEQIAARLDDAIHLLTGGSRTALPRQQTLKALIDWSYDLLSDAERTLLRWLAVFVGGWTLEAAEAVCGDDTSGDVLDLLTQLVDKSLVQAERVIGYDTRYRLLETVRQYAWDKLAESGEDERLRGRHLAYFLAFAEEATTHLFRVEQLEWLAQLDQNHDNFRAALDWAGQAAPTDLPDANLRLASALWRFWYLHSHFREGYARLAQAVRQAGPAAAAVRARALAREAHLATFADAGVSLRDLYEESLALNREVGDLFGWAFSLTLLSWTCEDAHEREALMREALTLARQSGEPWLLSGTLLNLTDPLLMQERRSEATLCFEESLSVSRKAGDRWGIAFSLAQLAKLQHLEKQDDKVKGFLEESLALFRELNHKPGIGFVLMLETEKALESHEPDRAIRFLEEHLALRHEIGDRWAITDDQYQLGMAFYRHGDLPRAAALLTDSLALSKELDDQARAAVRLAGLARVCAARGQLVKATRLFGAAQALGKPLESVEELEFVQAQLGGEAFQAAWDSGTAMTLEQAVAYALNPMNV